MARRRRRQPPTTCKNSGALGRWWRAEFEAALDEGVELNAFSPGFAAHVRKHGLKFEALINYVELAGQRHQRGGREPAETED